MDVTTKIVDGLKGVFIHRVAEIDGKPEILKPKGYYYKQTAFMRKPDETDEELQTRCLNTVAPWIPYPKEGLERPFALFTAINETADV